MISDTLGEARELLQKDLYHYTSGTYKNFYGTGLILEMQDIINRIAALEVKLWNPDFDGSFRYDPKP
jgi:hypothetical protein